MSVVQTEVGHHGLVVPRHQRQPLPNGPSVFIQRVFQGDEGGLRNLDEYHVLGPLNEKNPYVHVEAVGVNECFDEGVCGSNREVGKEERKVNEESA